MKRRIIAFLLALSCVAMLCAGCGPQRQTQETEPEQKATLYLTPNLGGANLKVYIPTNSDFEMNGSYLNTELEDYLNVNLDFIEGSPNSAVRELNAQGEIPDLIWTNGYKHSDWKKMIEDNRMFVNILDCLDQMPNLRAYLEDPANKEMVEKFTYKEGQMYAVPTWKTGSAEIYAYLYRKDIFDQHGLTFPTNQEEFVEVLRELKRLYPESEPFIMRSMKKNIQAAQHYGHLWGASHLNQSGGVLFTLDENGEYYLAQMSPAYKEMAEFWNMLMEEGLMSKRSMTVDTDGWYASFRANQSFITYDKVDRLPLMNQNGQMDNPEFSVVAGAPFNMGTHATKTDVVATSFAAGVASTAFMIGYGENMGEVLSYVDWLYSEEGITMTNWGVLGESYEVTENGTKQFKKEFLEIYGSLANTGLSVSGGYGIMDFDAYKAASEPYLADAITLAEQFAGKAPKQPLLPFTDAEQEIYITYAPGMYNYVCGEWYKFVGGERDFSQWDAALERAKSVYCYDVMIGIHQDAYERLKEEQ